MIPFQSRNLLLVFAILGILDVTALGQFETRGSFVTNFYPSSIAVGDFNHDGRLDLAVTAGASNSDTVAILLGNGDGTFQKAIYYTVGVGAQWVAASDFNHDGNLDLAVASQSSYIGIMLGNGDGTFQPAMQSPAVHNFERFVTTGDFNNDGNIDLVMRSDGNVVTVLLGNGDGTFQDGVVSALPFNVTAIGVGDFDRDGNLDLATAGTFGSGSVNILLGNGDGTFRQGASHTGGTEPGMIAVADLNGDHKLDLAISNYGSGSVSVLLGNGDGTFQPAIQNPTSTPNSVVVADVNGDGKPDLVAANALFPPGAAVFLGNGDGTFQPDTMYTAAGIVAYAATGDVNGDGKKDIILANNNSNTVITMLNTGLVTFFPTTALNFKKQVVGTTSVPQKVTLTNTGTAALRISSMKVSPQFGMTSTCHAAVAAGAKCTMSVTFSPTSKGAKSGTVTIDDSASSKPMVIELSGTGS